MATTGSSCRPIVSRHCFTLPPHLHRGVAVASRNRAQITRTVQAAVVDMLREGDMPAVGALPTLRNAGAQVGHSTEQLLAVRYVYGKISALPCATVAMHRSSTRRVSWSA